MYAQDSANHSYFKESSSDESFCLQLQAQSNHIEGKQIPNPCPSYNKPCIPFETASHQKYVLVAQLGTCADVNIMPASVYQLGFKDLEMKKIKQCNMQISIYTADTVKIIGSCIFDAVHPDMKKLVPVTFYVANNDGSVLLSCKTTLVLWLIQP